MPTTPNPVTTQPNYVPLTDSVTAAALVQGVTVDSTGNLTTSYQKILVNNTDNTVTNEGTVQSIAVSAATATAILTGVATDIQNAEAAG